VAGLAVELAKTRARACTCGYLVDVAASSMHQSLSFGGKTLAKSDFRRLLRCGLASARRLEKKHRGTVAAALLISLRAQHHGRSGVVGGGLGGASSPLPRGVRLLARFATPALSRAKGAASRPIRHVLRDPVMHQRGGRRSSDSSLRSAGVNQRRTSPRARSTSASRVRSERPNWRTADDLHRDPKPRVANAGCPSPAH